LAAIRLGRDYFIKREDAEEFTAAVNDPDLFRRRKRTARMEEAMRRLQQAGA
jgi:hypothetical protein